MRAREDVRVDLMRCRHRLSKFLLRRELYYPNPENAWTARRRDWLAQLRVADDAPEIVFQDALCAHDTLLARRDRFEREEVSQRVPGESGAPKTVVMAQRSWRVRQATAS